MNNESECNCAYQKALNKIQNYRENNIGGCCCFGPTGPTGPAGPATIEVGNTTTGVPGSEATVTNSGTNENVILDFVIPSGATGPTGPTGPMGVTPTVSLDSILFDNDGIQIVASGGLVDLGDVINMTGTSIIYTAPDTITIESGTYYILYSALVRNTATTSGDVGVTLFVNGVMVPNASEYVAATTTETQMVLQHNLTVTELTTISVSNISPVSNQYHDSSLSIIKLG